MLCRLFHNQDGVLVWLGELCYSQNKKSSRENWFDVKMASESSYDLWELFPSQNQNGVLVWIGKLCQNGKSSCENFSVSKRSLNNSWSFFLNQNEIRASKVKYQVVRIKWSFSLIVRIVLLTEWSWNKKTSCEKISLLSKWRLNLATRVVSKSKRSWESKVRLWELFHSLNEILSGYENSL